MKITSWLFEYTNASSFLVYFGPPYFFGLGDSINCCFVSGPQKSLQILSIMTTRLRKFVIGHRFELASRFIYRITFEDFFSCSNRHEEPHVLIRFVDHIKSGIESIFCGINTFKSLIFIFNEAIFDYTT